MDFFILSLLVVLRPVTTVDNETDTIPFPAKYLPFVCTVDQIGKTRLVDDRIDISDSESVNSEAMKGRIEVCWMPPPSYDDEYEFNVPLWGTICSSTFDGADAVCASLYYYDIGGRGTTIQSKTIATTWNTAPADQPIWLDGLECTGFETNLMECSYFIRNGEIANNCIHTQDMAIECSSRIRCNVCEVHSCNFEILAGEGTLCNKDEGQCVRHHIQHTDHGTMMDQTMGCSDQDCFTWLETCREDAAVECLCNECGTDNCNLTFLALYQINVSVIGESFMGLVEYLMDILNLLYRLALMDLSAYKEIGVGGDE